MRTEITLGDDILDSRNIIERIEELEGEREALVEAMEEAVEPEHEMPEKDDLDAWDNENAEELKNWKELADQCEGYSSDWVHGETLIRDTYWVEYCMDLVRDIGGLPSDFPDYIVIDWESTADNLKADYMEAEAGGETYFMRSC